MKIQFTKTQTIRLTIHYKAFIVSHMKSIQTKAPRKTPGEKLAERNAHANRTRREIGPGIGSPYRIHEATEKKARKATMQGPGRRNADEQAILDALRKIHAPRKLRDMLLALPYDMTSANEIVKTVNHWLMDLAHDRRMCGLQDEQDLIERIIETLGE